VWRIHAYLKCPVIGTCLTLEEQKKILKKTGHPVKGMSHYEIHATLISSLSDKNRLSVRIEALLNRKFKKQISEYLEIDKPLFLDIWKAYLEKGEIAGLLWVAAIRPDLTEGDVSSIFGDIHITMYMGAEENMRLRNFISQQQKEDQRLTEKLQDQKSLRRELTRENEGLKKELKEAQWRYENSEKVKLQLEEDLSKLRNNNWMLSVQTKNQQLQEQLRKISQELATHKQVVKSLQNQNNRLVSELNNQRNTYFQLKNEMEANMEQILALNSCDKKCPSFNLCRKRILIVGGIKRMESLYRQLIEENGGIFEYHDGHVKGGKRVLENQIKRADMVLCPVNINGHTACSLAKKISKKHGKSVQMLPNHGLGIISQILSEYGQNINSND
jgi:hypothetical protein